MMESDFKVAGPSRKGKLEDEKQFQCSGCNKIYSRKTNLSRDRKDTGNAISKPESNLSIIVFSQCLNSTFNHLFQHLRTGSTTAVRTFFLRITWLMIIQHLGNRKQNILRKLDILFRVSDEAFATHVKNICSLMNNNKLQVGHNILEHRQHVFHGFSWKTECAYVPIGKYGLVFH